MATFRLSDVFLAPAGKDAATVSHWPPTPPRLGEPIMLGGYPGMYREANLGNVKFDFAWFARKVNVEGDRSIGMVLDIAESVATSVRRIPANADLGGCSGGPVFRVVDSGAIERLELAAIIYQYSRTSETMLAHPLNSLTEDGGFLS